jgi:hypothetical protein
MRILELNNKEEEMLEKVLSDVIKTRQNILSNNGFHFTIREELNSELETLTKILSALKYKPWKIQGTID